MTIRKLPGSQIESNTITITQIQTTAVTNIVTQAGPRVTSLVYPGNDTAGNTVGGQTVYINGSGFETNNAIYINGNAVPSKSFISASNLSFTTPALSAGIYPVYVINTDSGATAIFIPGYISSAEPTWVTSAGSLNASQDELSSWSYNLSATGDTPITYALAAGSSLPGGVSLAANGLISGTISSPTGNATTYTFSVIATDAQNQDSTRQFTVTTSIGEGVLFANNVLLIHADGTNNQNNHAFLDSSNNNFTITRNGNATQGSFSPFSQTGWSVYFGSSTSNLILPSNSSFAIAAGNFTIEGFVNFTAWSGTNQRIFLQGVDGTDGIALYRNSGANNLIVGINTTEVISYSWSPVLGKWYHLAVVRSGTGSNQVALYIDGVSVATGTANASVAQNQFIIGGLNWASSYNMQGYISNVRYSNNARTVVVPTSAYTSDANTIALACQSNRFVDNSNNNFSITVNGTTSVVPFSPFAPTAAYSTANVGGSGYFDGTGDYLATPDNSALEPENSDLTWEMWIKTTSSTQYATLYSRAPSPFNTGMWSLMINEASNTAGDIALYMHEYSPSTYLFRTTGVNIRDDAWHHIAVVRSGSSWVCYVDGVSRATATWSGTTSNIASGPYVGADQNYGRNFVGYISGLRIVKGTAVYTGAFTPPTAPPTNIANTSLLLNYTNAGIFDQTAKNVLETLGDAKVSTAQYKYGTGSIYIPSTSDAVKMLGVDLLGDFTIEGWVKPSISGGEKFFIIQGVNQTNGFLIGLTTSEIRWRSNGTTDISAAISKADWYHFAITRSGSGSNNVKVFVDGTQVIQGTYTNTILASAGVLNIGPANLVGSFSSYGYIDDFRITKGYARYTSNFTPPTSALKDK